MNRRHRHPIGIAIAASFLSAMGLVDFCRSQPVTVPYDLLPGDKYRIGFVTTEERTAFSSDINEYNDFVTDVANLEPALVELGATWRVIGSTDFVDARDNTNTNPNVDVGLPIYLLDGFSKIADDNADLWDGDIDSFFDTYENGQTRENVNNLNLGPVYTGTASDGTLAIGGGAQHHTYGSLSGTVRKGSSFQTVGSWISATAIGAVQDAEFPFYALSSDLTVPRATPPGGSQGDYVQVTIKGDPAADGNGMLNGVGSYPVVNDHSQVLYLAHYVNTTNGPDDELAAVRHSNSGLYEQVLRSGVLAPDANGNLADFLTPALNNNGSSAYYAQYSETAGGIADDQGIVRVDSTGVHTIIREGDPTPDGDGQYYILNFDDMPSLGLNDSEQLAVHTQLQYTSAGFDNHTVVRGSPSGLLELARKGDPMPSGAGNYGSLGPPAINHAGAVAFHVSGITGAGTNARLAIVRQQGAIAAEIARSGEPAPDGNGVITPFGLDGDVAINEAGQVAFAAGFNNTTGGASDAFAMIRADEAVQHIVARAGDAAPDGNGAIGAGFHAFGPPRISEFGEVAFFTDYDGTSNSVLDDNAIVKAYANDAGREVVEVVREGWALPGGEGEFGNFGDPVDMNEVGVVAFTSALRNVPTPPFSPLGIFLGDGIDIVEVVRTGASLDEDEVFEVVSSGLGITQGSMNRHGQVAFSAQVRPGGGPTLSSAIYLFTPELYWRGGSIGAWTERRTQLGDVNNHAMKNWTLSLTPASMHDVIVDRNRATSFGAATPLVEITGPSADVTVKSLELREKTHLALIGDHNFTALEGIVLDAGRLSGSGRLVGNVEVMSGGALQADGLTVEGDVLNDGLLGVTAAASDYGVFNGTITNNGDTVIDNANAIASSATFNGNFINNGALVVGANQTAEFVGDYLGAGTLENQGAIVFHGLGPGSSPANVEVLGAGTIELAGSGETTFELGGTQRGNFHGDPVAQYDSLSLIDGGSLDLGGALIVELISPDGVAPIFSPSLGDVFTLFEADQIFDGFGSLQLPNLAPDLGWGVLQSAGELMLEVVDTASRGADLDNDGDVDGADFLLIQRFDPSLIPLWQQQFGMTNPIIAVPEPRSVWMILLCTCICLAFYRIGS